MNLLNKNWIKYKNKNIKIKKQNNSLRIINESNTHGFIVCPYIINGNNTKSINITFNGTISKGNGAIFQILDFNRNILSETSFNSSSNYLVNSRRFFCAIKISSRSEVIINNIDIDLLKEAMFEFTSILESKNDTLIITPSYPTEENKYFGAFVHTRVKAYKEAGLNFDLVCAHEYPNTCTYNFEGIDVTRTSFKGLREILSLKKYKTILLHFFDYKYAQILDACDLSRTNLYLWVHGPETLYWDWSKMTDPYFTPQTPLSSELVELFKSNDSLIKRYNSYKNVHWIFVSNWIKEKSEELINIKFNNYFIIPNYIDEQIFNYIPKDESARKKIFFIRRFEDINKYAIDINVKTILELSRRSFFKDLEFNIYGTGQNYDILIEPIRKFENVHLYPQFYTHSDIAKVHKENGIGLFATRYDAQGVSMCEAAMSGLAIVSSENDAIKEFIPCDDGLLSDTENYVAYANTIEKLYKNPKLFLELSKKCHDKVYENCNFAKTIQKEIDLIKSTSKINSLIPCSGAKKKVLSIIIPSYNVANYLYHGVYTMLNHENGDKIQVIIVNDGSKDGTINVAKSIQKDFSPENVTIIDKKNGGHGSTINEGLKKAVGKYVRIIDGDDWVNTVDLEKLIDILETDNSDIVITDYSEDRADMNLLIAKKIYQFMIPGFTYKFDDLCYDGYGFSEWGPILATANFKTEMLKKHMPKLTENSFYIDMEFDAYSISYADTITYYPLDIYRYFIGRVDQSISMQSYTKNFKQHENVLLNIIDFYTTSNITDNKKMYLLNKLIIPMIIAHYTILIQYLKSPKSFRVFEQKLKAYPAIYNHPVIATRMKKFHRKTNGIFIKYDQFLKKVFYKIKK